MQALSLVRISKNMKSTVSDIETHPAHALEGTRVQFCSEFINEFSINHLKLRIISWLLCQETVGKT